jgi:hypothetical protein
MFLVGSLFLTSEVMAAPTYFADRASFLAAVGTTITDDYSGYTPTPNNPVVLTNTQMSSVLGETVYESISFSDLNLVGNVYIYGDGTNYCAGCNGNFRLLFDDTSLSIGGGIFGVGVDIVLHTSRHSSIGSVIPGDTVVDGTVLAEFSDGSVEAITVPADVGFFGPEVFFLGLVDERGIRSLTIGTEPLPQRHLWVIDNLTVASAVPLPTPIMLLCSALPVFLAAARPWRPTRRGSSH